LSYWDDGYGSSLEAQKVRGELEEQERKATEERFKGDLRKLCDAFLNLNAQTHYKGTTAACARLMHLVDEVLGRR
jgi:hypothetical protein